MNEISESSALRAKLAEVLKENEALKITIEGLEEEALHLRLRSEEDGDDLQLLRALQAAGVDNWEGYGVACELKDEWNGVISEDDDDDDDDDDDTYVTTDKSEGGVN